MAVGTEQSALRCTTDVALTPHGGFSMWGKRNCADLATRVGQGRVRCGNTKMLTSRRCRDRFRSALQSYTQSVVVDLLRFSFGQGDWRRPSGRVLGPEAGEG
jgi:hypothetical protein